MADPTPPLDALRPLQRSRLYEQLVRRLLAHVQDSGLRPGDRLPPERELAQRLPDILEARAALEVKTAELAARRRTPADLAAIDAALAAMAAQVAAGEHGEEGDSAFHRAVTAAAHNPVLTELMELLAGPIRETRRESLAQPGRPPRSLASHRRIAEAIRAGDPTRAVRAMRAHLDLVGNVALLQWAPDGGEEG